MSTCEAKGRESRMDHLLYHFRMSVVGFVKAAEGVRIMGKVVGNVVEL